MTSRENRRLAADRCLKSIRHGSTDDLFALLPQISVLRDPRFFDTLKEMLFESNGEQREFATIALGALKDHRGITVLTRCLSRGLQDHRPSAVRWVSAIVQALGDIGSDQATPYLENLVQQQHPEWESAWGGDIVESLGKISQQGGSQALNALIKLAQGPNLRLCLLAIPEISVSFWHRPQVVPDPVVQMLTDLLADEAPEVRVSAVAALETLADLGCSKAQRTLRRHAG